MSHVDLRIGLPCAKKLPPRSMRGLGPWLRSLLDLTPDRVRATLEHRWTNVPTALRPLRDRILSAGSPALVSGEGSAFLELTLTADETPDRDGERWSWSLFVAPPISERTWGQELRRLRLSPRSLVAAFARHFDFLRESEPGLAGGFKPLSEWRTIEEDAIASNYSWYTYLPEKMRREWAGSVIVFGARNGDEILLHSSGKIGWLNHEQSLVRKEWSSFEEFIARYADFIEYRWPFDCWGPSDEAVNARKNRERRRRNRSTSTEHGPHRRRRDASNVPTKSDER